MKFLFDLIFPRTKLYFKKSGKEVLVIGPKKLLDPMGYFGKVVFGADGYLLIANTLNSGSISIGTNSINSVRFDELEFESEEE